MPRKQRSSGPQQLQWARARVCVGPLRPSWSWRHFATGEDYLLLGRYSLIRIRSEKAWCYHICTICLGGQWVWLTVWLGWRFMLRRFLQESPWQKYYWQPNNEGTWLWSSVHGTSFQQSQLTPSVCSHRYCLQYWRLNGTKEINFPQPQVDREVDLCQPDLLRTWHVPTYWHIWFTSWTN